MVTRAQRLGGWLGRVLEEWGWSGQDFADATGVSDATLRAWRRGDRDEPQPTKLRDVARGMRIPHQTLVAVMRGDDVPIPPEPAPEEPQELIRMSEAEVVLMTLGRLEATLGLILQELRQRG